jgi:hypothetical protein
MTDADLFLLALALARVLCVPIFDFLDCVGDDS